MNDQFMVHPVNGFRVLYFEVSEMFSVTSFASAFIL